MDIQTFIQNNLLFSHLSRDEKVQISDFIEKKQAFEGEILIQEGDPTEDLYFLISGLLSINKNSSQGVPIKMGEIEAGRFFGEVSFLDGRERSATLQASTPCEYFVVSKKKLLEKRDIFIKIESNLSAIQAMQFRNLNNQFIQKLEEQILYLKESMHYSIFMISILVSVSIAFFVSAYVLAYAHLFNVRSGMFGVLYTFIIVLPSSIAAWRMGYPLSFFGLTLKNFWPAVWEGLKLAIPVFLLVAACNYAYRVMYLGEGFFSHAAGNSFKAGVLLYPIAAYLQEFTARGVLQTGLEKFLGKEKREMIIFFSALLFALTHFQFGASFAILTFIGSVFLGYIYYFKRSLVTCTVVHSVMGWILLAVGF